MTTKSDDGKHRTKSREGEPCFFYFKKCGLSEPKMLQCTTLSIKLHHCTLSKLKTQIVRDFRTSLNALRGQKSALKLYISTETYSNTLQTCINIAFEYLQAWSIHANVLNRHCCSPHHTSM